MLSLIAGGIAGLGSYLSGKKQASAQGKANWNNMQFAREQYRYQKALNAQNRKDQFEFAKNSAGWQFDDLMKSADQAGIHRLSAIGGASASQYSPVSGTGLDANQQAVNTGYLGDAIGEGVSAALSAYQMQQQVKTDKANLELRKAEVENRKAETELLRAQSRTQIAGARNAQTNLPANLQDGILYIKTSNGQIVPVPVGPGLDEVVTGAAIEGGGQAKGFYNRNSTPQNFPQYHGKEGNVGPPGRQGKYLGEIYRPNTGVFEYQWTKGGWKRRKRRDK